MEGRCSGEPWTWSYEIVDPRVEVLRRLNRLVFASSAHWIRMERRLTESWYALLLERRFQPARFDEALVSAVRKLVACLNREWLAVWSEMLEFARAGPILEAGKVNDAAGRWVSRVNAGCMHGAGILSDLGLSPSTGPEAEVVPSC
jgi:hypothetical protein